MSLENISRVILEWSAFSGLPLWDPSEHLFLVLDNTPACISCDPADAPGVMHVLCNLGRSDACDLDKTLLQLNFYADRPFSGCFGIEPQSGDVLYRLDIVLETHINGADITGYIDAAIKSARNTLCFE